MNEEDEFLGLLRQQRDAILTQAAVRMFTAPDNGKHLDECVDLVAETFRRVQKAMVER